MNYIINNLQTTKVSLSRNALNMLKSAIPKDYPFDNYTLADLLFDFVKMYSWRVRGKMSLENFIKHLQKEGESKAIAYGDSMIARLVD